MILTFDIGNTRTNIGLYKDSLVKKFWILSKDLEDGLEEVLSENIPDVKITGAVIGSVVKGFEDKISNVLRKIYSLEAVVISYKSNLPIKLGVDYPEKLGVDRLINGACAYNKFNQSVIVIDCGSAITLDVVNNEGEFLGGIIALGLKNQLQAISSYTSALPELSLKNIETNIGKNTQEAILSGVVNGTASMIDGMIEKCLKELGDKPKIILTGGDAGFIQSYLKTKIDIVDENFTLNGLKYLYSLNCA